MTTVTIASVAYPQTEEKPIVDPVLIAWGDHPGVVDCADCHFHGPIPNPLRSRFPHALSQQHVVKQWVESDRHAVARQRIEPYDEIQLELCKTSLKEACGLVDVGVSQWIGTSNRLSKLICERLGIKPETKSGDQLFRDNCLTCHGGYSANSPAKFDPLSGHKQPGISCTYCHTKEGNTSWVERHRDRSKWRMLPPLQKEQAGMRHLTSTSVRAQLCSDCHVGNLEQNKFVTHAMYAAGHPPLPSFELATFSEAMPKHWNEEHKVYDLLSPEDRGLYFKRNFPALFQGSAPSSPDNIYWRTREVLLASVETRIHALKLVVEASPTDLWGDYALYDCSACHHELKVPSHRQRARLNHDHRQAHDQRQGRVVGAPGRPRPIVWPNVLLESAAIQVGKRKDLNHHLESIEKSFAAQPFGNRKECHESALNAMKWLETFREDLKRISLDRTESIKLFNSLSQTSDRELHDYDAARQLVWALWQISAELDRHGLPLPSKTATQLTILKTNAGIGFAIPNGRENYFDDFLETELHRRADFQPLKLFDALHAIRSAQHPAP